MRRLCFLTLVLLALVAPAAAQGFRNTTRRAPWALVDVARDGRAVRVDYLGGGCEGEAKARVIETRADVSIRLDQAVSIPEGDREACSADLVYYSLVVHLRHPIAGRRIRGHAGGSRAAAAALHLFRLHGDRVIWLVPRVVGLAPHDARRLLRLQGFRIGMRPDRGCARRARVIAQWPHGHSVQRSRRIGLVVRRSCA
jgi:hypothetical protein